MNTHERTQSQLCQGLTSRRNTIHVRRNHSLVIETPTLASQIAKRNTETDSVKFGTTLHDVERKINQFRTQYTPQPAYEIPDTTLFSNASPVQPQDPWPNNPPNPTKNQKKLQESMLLVHSWYLKPASIRYLSNRQLYLNTSTDPVKMLDSVNRRIWQEAHLAVPRPIQTVYTGYLV